MRKKIESESGWAVVEATILLPFCTFIVAALFYVAIFMCQKANIQAAAENALVYMKNHYTDTYLDSCDIYQAGTLGADVIYEDTPASTMLNPYEPLFNLFSEDSTPLRDVYYQKYLQKFIRYMFLTTLSESNIEEFSVTGFPTKTISVKLKQTLNTAVDLSAIGFPSTYDISVNAKVVYSDQYEFISTLDYGVALLSRTKVGKKIEDITNGLKDKYDSLIEKLDDKK